MTPEAASYLRKARIYIVRARNWLSVIHEGDEAARTAYLAGFHAAQAPIFERTGKIAKTHRGVRSEFARLAADEVRLGSGLTQFLARDYQRKEFVDYDMSAVEVVTAAEAREMIETAACFVDCIAQCLAE